MSNFREKTLDFLRYLEQELREYASGAVYDDQAESAFRFMDDLADEISTFLEETANE